MLPHTNAHKLHVTRTLAHTKLKKVDNKTNEQKNKERIPPKGDINWCPLHPATTAAALTKTATPILSCLFTRAHKNEVKGRSGDKGTDICVEGLVWSSLNADQALQGVDSNYLCE
jgi:hypothetical protein